MPVKMEMLKILQNEQININWLSLYDFGQMSLYIACENGFF